MTTNTAEARDGAQAAEPLALRSNDLLGLVVAAAGCPPADYVAPGIVPAPIGRMYSQTDLDAAVAAERERCAKVVENQNTYGDPIEGWLELLAEKIRS
jgi:hypothetical protein